MRGEGRPAGPPRLLRRRSFAGSSRSDVLVAGIGAAAAIVALAVLVVGRLGLVSVTAAATVAVAIAAVVGAACFFQFGSGPARALARPPARDRAGVPGGRAGDRGAERPRAPGRSSRSSPAPRGSAPRSSWARPSHRAAADGPARALRLSFAAVSQAYVYSMHRVQKFHGPDRQVLRDISLSFLPGAKIGVLGPNGAGQVDAPADHGGPRRAVFGRRPARAGRNRRLPAAGARARSGQGRARERRGRRRREARPAPAVRGDLGALRRADVRRRDDGAPRGAGRGAGPDRPHRRLEPRPHARHRHGRPPLPAERRRGRRRCRAASAAGSRCAASCSRRPTSCSSTSRPTTSTPSPSPGSSGSSPSTPARCSP